MWTHSCRSLLALAARGHQGGGRRWAKAVAIYALANGQSEGSGRAPFVLRISFWSVATSVSL